MKTHTSIFLYLSAVVIFVGNLPSGISAETEKKSDYWTINPADKAACQRQLNIIYGAIQEYQKRKEKPPRWLSDLLPDYIDDPNILVCPFVISSGNLKKYRESYLTGVFADPGSCTYAYEFCAEPVHWAPGWTARDYKQSQMELIGLAVPIVRCFAHRPILNLGFDGSIYASPGEWEDNFVVSEKHHTAFHDFEALTNRSRNQLIRSVINPRTTETDARMLDLSAHYNALLLHLSQMDQTGKLLITYPEGVQKIGSVNFDVRGLVHLTGKDFPIRFPQSVSSITVDRKCAYIHFLHGTIFTAMANSKIASYIVHQGDGHGDEVPIVYGKDVRTRWFDPNRESEAQTPKPAWISPQEKIGATGKSLRLYVRTWKNPHPDLEVKTIDFVSHKTESAPFLLAITVE
jgi:hypothetical protein